MVQCSRCHSTHVYCMQTTNESGTINWEVVKCQECNWPEKDTRSIRGIERSTHAPGQIKKLSNTGERLKEYPK